MARTSKKSKDKDSKKPSMRDLTVSKKKSGSKKRRLKAVGTIGKPSFLAKLKLPDNRFGRFLGKTGRLLIPRYFREAWAEIKLTTWPSRRETIRLTIAVFVFSAVFATFVAGLDFVLDKIFKSLITQ